MVRHHVHLHQVSLLLSIGEADRVVVIDPNEWTIMATKAQPLRAIIPRHEFDALDKSVAESFAHLDVFGNHIATLLAVARESGVSSEASNLNLFHNELEALGKLYHGAKVMTRCIDFYKERHPDGEDIDMSYGTLRKLSQAGGMVVLRIAENPKPDLSYSIVTIMSRFLEIAKKRDHPVMNEWLDGYHSKLDTLRQCMTGELRVSFNAVNKHFTDAWEAIQAQK